MIRSIFLLSIIAFSMNVMAGEIQIPGTTVWFVAPDGFSKLDQEEIDVKFPSKTAPRHAIGNERRTTTVAYDVRDVEITDEALERQIDDIDQMFGRAIPGFESIDRGMRTLNGKKWAYFEMKSNALDADIHNIVLMTAHQGRMVVLNFNSTKSEFVAIEPLLRASISTLHLRE